jgi:hypothetical protein
MPSKTLEMDNLFIKSKLRFYYIVYLVVKVVGSVVYHIMPNPVVSFSIAILKMVSLQKRQSFLCNLEGQNYTK